MKRTYIPLFILLAACESTSEVSYTEDGRRICKPNEPLHSGCVVEIASCYGAPITPDQQAKACR